MKTSSKKPLIISALTALAFAGVGAGVTFALFTSESQATINATAGKIQVSGAVTNFKTYSAEANPSGDRIDENGAKYNSVLTAVQGTFTNGGTASALNGVITLDKITPGDRITFDYDIGQTSNVDFLYRVSFRSTIASEDLLKGLTTKIAQGNETNTYYGLKTYVSPWIQKSPSDALDDLSFDIELPIQKGNAFQEKVAKFALTVEAVQANAAVTQEAALVTVQDDFSSAETAVENQDTVVEATNEAEDISVKVTIPAATQEVEAGNEVELVVSDATLDENHSENETRLDFDVSLLVDGVEQSTYSELILVEINIGPGKDIVSVTHNDQVITDYEYNPTTGIVRFYTSSFSPFSVVYYDIPNYPVRIGKVGYPTFQAAVIDFLTSDMTTAKITIEADLDYALGARKDIPAGKNLTIDLNGHVINNAGASYNHILRVNGGFLSVIDNSGTGLGEMKTGLNSANIISALGASTFHAENVKLTSWSAVPVNIAGSTNVTLDNVHVSIANSKYSAGIMVTTTGSFDITNSYVAGGPAIQFGSSFTGTAIVDNCDLVGRYSAIVNAQNSANTAESIVIRNSRLTCEEASTFAPGVYVQGNTKNLTIRGCTIDMSANSCSKDQYAVRITSEGVSTVNVENTTITGITGYIVCMDMDGYGNINFTNCNLTSTKQTVEMDHAGGNANFYAGCNIHTGQSGIYYTVSGSMTTVNPGVTMNVNPGESNYKYTVNGLAQDNGDGTWTILANE